MKPKLKPCPFEELFGDYDGNPHILMDEKRAEKHRKSGKTICERCEGTGNELYSMYRKCSDCNGKGYKEKL